MRQQPYYQELNVKHSYTLYSSHSSFVFFSLNTYASYSYIHIYSFLYASFSFITFCNFSIAIFAFMLLWTLEIRKNTQFLTTNEIKFQQLLFVLELPPQLHSFFDLFVFF
jgi:hypothetical protein